VVRKLTLPAVLAVTVLAPVVLATSCQDGEDCHTFCIQSEPRDAAPPGVPDAQDCGSVGTVCDPSECPPGCEAVS
jgi:hypothetical protein